MTTTNDIQTAARNLWQREGGHCVSALVSTLAKHDGQSLGLSRGDDLAALTEQAFDLCCPLDDWESAAREAGWEMFEDNITHKCRSGNNTGDDEEYADDWQEACEISCIEPYQREVFEFWVVSDWLADQLAALGEKVDKDFAGLTVWARTTSGQAVYADWVMEKIAEELNGEALPKPTH